MEFSQKLLYENVVCVEYTDDWRSHTHGMYKCRSNAIAISQSSPHSSYIIHTPWILFLLANRQISISCIELTHTHTHSDVISAIDKQIQTTIMSCQFLQMLFCHLQCCCSCWSNSQSSVLMRLKASHLHRALEFVCVCKITVEISTIFN